MCYIDNVKGGYRDEKEEKIRVKTVLDGGIILYRNSNSYIITYLCKIGGYMKKNLVVCYRTLKHNINYKENYFKNLLIVLLILLIIDLIMLYVVII